MVMSASAHSDHVPECLEKTVSKSTSPFSRVVACVDASEFTKRVVSHAMIVAKALNIPLTLFRVLEVGNAGKHPHDPVEWDMRRHEARREMAGLARKCADDGDKIDVQVVEGRAAEQISLRSHDHRPTVTVLCTHGESGPGTRGIGVTARQVIEAATGTVLLVPASALPQTSSYRRVMVPVDGSCRAESVLPLAMRIAQAGGELILAHVVPTPELTQIGPLASEDVRLREQLADRNERVVRSYLDHLKLQLAGRGISVRIIVKRGDVRDVLPVLAKEADLVVLSAQGYAGRAGAPYGTVTSHLMDHTSKPLLIVQRLEALPPVQGQDYRGIRVRRPNRAAH
ncbi:MAG: universal stress protein [Alphaproteobacteria bacterium HGW-Alphaproteobacteria-5]|nr:MAG: universal stress protein [Alphaproteobacteria bacterium HGW-Alphaproteobacteria-5]